MSKITYLILPKSKFIKFTTMTNADFTKTSSDQKIAKLGSDKNLQPKKQLQIEQKDSLIFWVENYFDKMIFKGKVKTKKAKKWICKNS